MDKKDEQVESQSEHISICDIMKGNTSKTIKKMELGIPSLVQNSSDLYTAYLHMFDDLFGTCYLAEKEFFDKLNIHPKILQEIKKSSDILTDNYLNNIETIETFFDAYTKMRISAIKSFDNHAHIMMESYAQILSQFNKTMNTE
jgi:hypothetical protein